MSGSELPKIVDKTWDDIEATIAANEASDLPAGIREFTISCVRLAVWLTKALFEQKIKLSNLEICAKTDTINQHYLTLDKMMQFNNELLL